MKKRISLCLAIILVVSAIFSAISYASSGWVWPVSSGRLGCTFKCQCSTHKGRHSGIDINGVPEGTPIMAAHSGTVTCVNNYQSENGKCPTCGSFGAGYHVEIYCGDNLCTQYAHMSRTADLYIGQQVSAGQIIGYVGKTGAAYGAHLHLAMAITTPGGHFTSNYVDPLNYISPGSVSSNFPFTGVWVENVTTDSAVLWATFNLQYYNECGFYIGKSENSLKKVSESVNASVERAWYDAKSWYGILEEGTKYYYQMYVVQNGKEYRSSLESFVTLGSAPSASPFTGVWVENVTADNAVLWATFNLQYYSECGFYIGKSSGSLNKISESVNANADRSWYDLKKWYGGLDEGTKYYYQMYVVQNGQEFKSSVESFVSLGTPRVVSIDIVTMPNKTTYNIDDEVDFTGMRVVANYTDGTTFEISSYSISEISTDIPGEKSVVVSYGPVSASFKITVAHGLLGDVDSNDVVNVSDVIQVLKTVAGWDVKIVNYRADINRDGKINVQDAILILKYIAGWEIKYFDDYNDQYVPSTTKEPATYIP